MRYKKSTPHRAACSFIILCSLNSSALYAEFRFEPSSVVKVPEVVNGEHSASASQLQSSTTKEANSITQSPLAGNLQDQGRLPANGQSKSGWRFHGALAKASSPQSSTQPHPASKNKTNHAQEVARVPVTNAEALLDIQTLVQDSSGAPTHTKVSFGAIENGLVSVFLDHRGRDRDARLNLLFLNRGKPWLITRHPIDELDAKDEWLMAGAQLLSAHAPNTSNEQRAAAIYFRNKHRFDRTTWLTREPVHVPTHQEILDLSQAESEAVLNRVRLFGSATKNLPKSNIQNAVAGPKQTDTCKDFLFSQGLLKPNLESLLADCGYSIGQWALGDQEYEYDFEIPKSYVLNRVGIEQLLAAVESTYLIRGTRNVLDKTIDFEPSRGAILDGMEIKEW